MPPRSRPVPGTRTAVGRRLSCGDGLGQGLTAGVAAGPAVSLRHGFCDFLDPRVDLNSQSAAGKNEPERKEETQGSHGYDRDEVIHCLIIPENPGKARAI